MANNSIWIMGDNLLLKAGGYYEAVKKSLREKKLEGITQDNRLYIDQHYAVKVVSPGLYDHANVPLIVLDSVVDTLNHNAKIPHTIVILLNDRKFWNNKALLTHEMRWILKKFFKEFNKILDARKYALDEKAVNWDYPRLFVTRPLPLPSNLPVEDYPTGFRSNRRKFNKLLDKAQSDGKFTVMNLGSFSSQNKNKLFNPDGTISEKGYHQIWIELSDTIQRDDAQVRTMMNKLKAKQMAKNMEAELLDSDGSDNEGAVPIPQSIEKQQNKKSKSSTKSPVRRSLLRSFVQLPSPKPSANIKSASPSHSPKHQHSERRDRVYHHKQPQKRFAGFYKPRRRYHRYFHQYPQPDFYPQPRYYPY